MVGAYSQVCQNSVQQGIIVVNFFAFVPGIKADIVADESEIVVDEGQTLVFRSVGKGIGVSVESHKRSFGGKSGKYFPAVTASAEGGIRIAPVRIGDKGVDAWF